MKRTIVTIFVLVFFLFTNLTTFSYADNPETESGAVLLMDAETGQILYEKNAHQPMYPASTTKILTGIIAIETCDLDEKITVDRQATLGIEGSHIALEPGEVLTMKDLLYALLIESANDAAKAIAIHISGSVDEFSKLMNTKAKEIGAKNSNFVNPNGLHDSDHVSTAYDLAIIAQYAMKNEIFRGIVNNYLYKIEPTNKKSEPRYLKSSNKLLYSYDEILVDGKYIPIKYYGAHGIKTGYTPSAQNCLVTAATRNNQTLISVVLKAVGRNVYIDTHNLLNYGFDNYALQNLAYKNSFIKNVEVKSGVLPFATAVIADNLKALVPANNDGIYKRISINEEVKAPVAIGQVLGKVDYLLDDEIVGSVNIVSVSEVEKSPVPSILNISSKDFIFRKWWMWPLVVIVFIITRLKIRQLRRRNRRRRRAMFS